jgi:hypothetical protein
MVVSSKNRMKHTNKSREKVSIFYVKVVGRLTGPHLPKYKTRIIY